jgi:hypothetical protein
MKKLLVSFALIAISFIANSQNVDNVQAMITGYKLNDTIKVSDFLKLSEISLNNKDYRIVSFRLTFEENKLLKAQDSKSNKISDEQKNMVSNIKDKDREVRKMYIENIVVQKSQNKSIEIKPLIYSLKIK